MLFSYIFIQEFYGIIKFAGGGFKRCFQKPRPWQPDDEAKEEHSGFALGSNKTGFRTRIGLFSSRTDDRAYLPLHTVSGENSRGEGFSSKPSLITLLQSPVAHGEDEFDQSLGGRRISAYYDSDGALSDLPFQVLTRFYQAAWESRMSRSRRKSAISRNVATAAAAKIPKRWAARPTS